MKRMTMTVLSILYLAGLCTAAPSMPVFPKNEQLERIVTDHVKKQAAPRSSQNAKKVPSKRTAAPARQKGSRVSSQDANRQSPSLQNLKDWANIPVISWQTYEQANKQIVEKQEKIQQLYNEIAKEESFFDMVNYKVKQGVPSYAKIVANTRYIFIGEAHNFPAIQREIKQIIRTVRQVNPNKKILLATEFLTTPHPLVNPLHKDGKEWLLSETGYNIAELAAQLHMDTLALDDTNIQLRPNSQSGILVKLGNRYVSVDVHKALEVVAPFDSEIDEQINHWTMPKPLFTLLYFLTPQEAFSLLTGLDKNQEKEAREQATKLYGRGNENYVLLHELLTWVNSPDPDFITLALIGDVLKNILSVSPWGVLQRNHQWAQRIKQVEENYDVIIIWGGDAHFSDADVAPSVSSLLDYSNSIEFSLLPLDLNTMDKKTADGYLKREEILDRQKLNPCSVEFDSEGQANVSRHCQGIESINPEQPFFIETKAMGNLSEASPKVQSFEKQLEQLIGINFKDNASYRSYQIFVK